MTTFYPQQSDCGRRVQKMANADTFNFTPPVAPSNLHSHVHEARKNVCSKFQGAVQEHVNEWSFYTREALPLVSTRILRLANSSPKIARSPARRSRDGRETSGKKSGEMSRIMSAQRPGNGRTVAAAMPSNVRQDNSQDGSPCAGFGCAMSAPETCETTRNLAAQRPTQHLASSSWEFRRQLLTMTSKTL
jgi:hypothetical protein